VGYTAFKAASAIEYIELPTTTDSIYKEAFHGCRALQQLICKAIEPPGLDDVVFRDANGTNVRAGVPAEAVAAYRASRWNVAVYAGAQAFAADQIVSYHTIAYDGVVAGLQSAGVAGFLVKVVAGEAPAGQSFSGWSSEPAGVQFTNQGAATTYFTMPGNDVTIRASFATRKTYTIIGATISQSGEAAVGSSVNLGTGAEKIESGTVLYFQRWQINRGAEAGLVIDNPNVVSTSFTMIDGDVEIEAVYLPAYMVNIQSGSTSQLEYFEGDVVTVTAANRPNQTFINWTSNTEGVVFADATAKTTTFIMPPHDVNISANFHDRTAINTIGCAAPKLYPNPAADYIQWSGAENVSYTIHNAAGSIVKKGITNGKNIPLSGLSKGVYLLKMEETGFYFRFLKK
jgi:hypothetical protein